MVPSKRIRRFGGAWTHSRRRAERMRAHEHDLEPGNALEAYVLVQTEPGKADSVIQETETTPGIIGADAVTGPCDIIARARAASLEDLHRRIIPRIHALDGVIRLLVSPIVRR
jgi:DNA-binding Lrp family transcriptional regulator